MCFSATASFTTGAVLAGAGGLTLAKAKTPKELPLASIPLLFGIQQIVEGVVWVSFGIPSVHTASVYAFSVFSHVVWPVLVPLALLFIEEDPHRRNMLKVFFAVGAAVGLYLLHFILTDAIDAHIVGNSIAYDSVHLYPFMTLMMYLIAACGSWFVSSHKTLNVLGGVLLVSFGIALWFYKATFFSVWCFFAAIISLILILFFKERAVKN